MADPLSSLIRPSRAPSLPALERFAPPPPGNVLTDEIEARSRPGDIVLELHGRGGWVARAVVDRLRRAFLIETSALTRLVAEIVLRPPDLRHLDAAVSGLAADTRADSGLRHALSALYASSCVACQSPVSVDEFIWEAEASDPSRKSYRCPRCREGRSDGRPVSVDPDDIYAARAIDPVPARQALLARFPVPVAGHPLPGELLDLYPPRAITAIWSILERIENDLRAPSIQAALRLALLHVLLPASRLNGYPGRLTPLRVGAGHVRPPGSRLWRERNVWQLFEDGCRTVRAFIVALEAGGARTPTRIGPDLRALIEGTANLALRYGAPLGPETFGPPPRAGADPTARHRIPRGVRLVLSQPPIHWSADSLAFAYLGTCIVVGPEGTSTLPMRALFGPPVRADWAWDAASLRRSLIAVRPVLASEGTAVIVLDRTGPEGLVASVIGGVGAGLRLDDAVLAEQGDDITGLLEFGQPDSPPREARRAVIGDVSDAGRPFLLSAVEASVTDITVAVLKARGEPTRFERFLGEVLIGLDHLGHLRRLVGTRTFEETQRLADAGARAVGLFGEVPPSADRAVAQAGTTADRAVAQAGTSPARPPLTRDGASVDGLFDGPDTPPAWDEGGSAADPVRLTLEIITGELRRPSHPRLVELEDGRWWLRDPSDLADVATPLSDRVEWAVFGLLSTSDGIAEAGVFDRIARLFRGAEAPDAELVRACLDSYRSGDPGPDGKLRTDDELQARYQEHGEIVGLLTDFAHRLGMRAWIMRREQRRSYHGAPLEALLSEAERRVYLPLVAPGPQEALEAIDCIWYVRGKGAFLFDVEWMAQLDEPLRVRGARIPTSDTVVRFLVVPAARTELVRLKLARSPLLRERLEEDNWHILKWEHVRRLQAVPRADLATLGPLIGLDPDIERQGDQMGLFT
jgi:hypothetical protein